MSANVEIVRAWMRALNDDDEAKARALITPDFELVESETLPGALRARGEEGLRRYAAGWRRTWSEWDWREVEVVDIPPMHVVLVADLELRGRQSGISVCRRWVYLFAFRGGRLAQQVGFDDKDAAIRAAEAG